MADSVCLWLEVTVLSGAPAGPGGGVGGAAAALVQRHEVRDGVRRARVGSDLLYDVRTVERADARLHASIPCSGSG